jgi:hypothetical protein
MRGRLFLCTIAFAFAAVPATASAGLISLRIQFRAEPGASPRILTLRCGERPTGTVARPAASCARLQRLGEGAFRPTPAGTACTEISGGPSEARVTGTYFGRRLWVKLTLANGCEIARWQRVAFLLPPPSAP